MRTIGFTTIGLLLATALTAGDGAKPDFSGTWVFNPGRSRLEMTAPTKSTFVIEQMDQVFKLTRTHTWGEKLDTLSFEVAIDGNEHYSQVGEVETWSRMYWMGEELVLNSRIAYRGEEGTNVVHYRLADKGATLIAAEWFHMPTEQHHNYWVFERAPQE